MILHGTTAIVACPQGEEQTMWFQASVAIGALAELQLVAGDLHAAVELYRAALDTRRTRAGRDSPTDPRVLVLEKSLANLYVRQVSRRHPSAAQPPS